MTSKKERQAFQRELATLRVEQAFPVMTLIAMMDSCLLYTSDAADE